MEEDQALELAGQLYAAFPGRSISRTSVILAASELLEMGEDAPLVIRRAIEAFRSPPSIGDLHDLWRELRQEQEQLALPAGPEEIEAVEMPAEVRERLAELRERWDAPEPEPDWEERKRQVLARARLVGVCPAVGQPARLVDGHALCPRCGTDLDPDCPPRSAAACGVSPAPPGGTEGEGDDRPAEPSPAGEAR